MTLDEAFALVRANALTWHGLYEDPRTGVWEVRLRTQTRKGAAVYGLGLGLDLIEAIRKAILSTQQWQQWRPKVPSDNILADLGLDEADQQTLSDR